MLVCCHVARRREVGRPLAETDIPRFRHRTDVDLEIAEHVCELRRPLDRFVDRAQFQDRKSGDQLLRLGERPILDRALAAVELQSHALCTRPQAIACDQFSGLDDLSNHLADVLDELERGNRAAFPVRVGPVHDEKLHRCHSRVRCAKNSVTTGVSASGFTL